ncbi:hypothetical protein CW304_21455 [Bacillus sp. UFRGS-B20]|nr:hypothetical protein CW304_21455 [Bacillus sp. UFRGS-B20]
MGEPIFAVINHSTALQKLSNNLIRHLPLSSLIFPSLIIHYNYCRFLSSSVNNIYALALDYSLSKLLVYIIFYSN